MKKKTLYLLIIAIFTALLLILGGTQVKAEETIAYGDVNCDGNVNNRDSAILSSYLAQEKELTRLGLRNADVNADGVVNNVDCLLLMQFTVGLHDNTLPNKPITDYVLYGDVNCDGAIDNKDEKILYDYLEANRKLSEQMMKNADINGNGKIGWTDYELLINREQYGSVLLHKPITEYHLYDNYEYTKYSDNSNKVSITKYKGTDSYIEIPKHIEDMPVGSIGIGAFEGNTNVEQVVIQNKKDFIISSDAFKNCSNLKTVIFQGEWAYFGEENPFDGCNQLLIECIENSIVQDYAIKNNIPYQCYLKKLNEIMVEHKIVPYTGDEIKANITVTNNENVELKEGTDYKVTYKNNINVGLATVIVEGIGDYTGIIEEKFRIVARDINDNYMLLVYTSEDREYTGKEITTDVQLTATDIDYHLKEDIDYILRYKNNTNVGTATVTIEGIGNYQGTLTGEFKIVAKNISDVTANVDTSNKTYTGEKITTEVSLKDGNTALKEGTDYKVTYKNNINVGTATVVIEGVGNYTGSIEKSFKIVEVPQKDLSDITAIISTVDKTYTGSAIKTSIVLKDGNYALREGKDYKVTYKNNTNVGTAIATITGVGNYKGSIVKKFKITTKNLSSVTTSVDTNNKIYTGKDIRTSISLKNGNTALKEGIDYTVSYKNNINTGTATVTITAKGNYAGTITKTFKIIPKKVSISSVKNVSKKSAKVTWKKDTQTTGYEVYMSTAKKDSKYMKTKSKLTLRKSTSTKSKKIVNIPKGAKVQILKKNVKRSGGYTWYKVKYNGKTGYVASKYLETIYNEGKYSKVKTITSNKTTSYTKTKLSKGKKYTFKIRSYKVIDGKKYYSSYSSVKWVTIKK